MTRTLRPWAQELADDFWASYRDGNCSCHISPPCGSCTHPGNPLNLENTDDAFEFEFDFEADLAMFLVNEQIKKSSAMHIAEMKAQWANRSNASGERQ